MKKVNHWINGKNVAGNDYFQTTNPATGEVLADVASGGEAEINQAVAAAKEAFPKWANLPMKERARLMRRLGADKEQEERAMEDHKCRIGGVGHVN